MLRINPRYFNWAEDEESSGSFEPIDFRFKIGKLVEIPTKEDEFDIDFGELSDVIIVQGKNIIADLYYHGQIKCRDFEDRSLEGQVIEQQDYPPTNPIFHSENLENVGHGHYRFRTKLASRRSIHLPSLSYAREHISDDIRTKHLTQRDLPTEIKEPVGVSDDLEQTLKKLYEIVYQATNGHKRDDGYYIFEELVQEYLSTGKISGDCKAVSTFTSGLLNALGLPARVIDGDIISQRSDARYYDGSIRAYREGHVWSEVYVPMNEREGFWIPVDPFGLRILKTYPSGEGSYAYCRVALPKFLDQDVKTAKLRISHE